MMKMKSINTQLFIYVILDIFVLIFSMFKGYSWIANTQIAFMGAFCVVLLSFLSYIRNINKQIEALGDIIDERDYIDELDDPYELYDTKDSSDEKKNRVKISMKNLSKSKSAAFSLLRVLGYAILIAGFFLLLKMNIFHIVPYLVGISIIPIGGLINIIYQKSL